MKNCSCLAPAESQVAPKLIKKFNKELENCENTRLFATEFLYIAKNILTAGDKVWAQSVLKRAEEVATDYRDIEFIARSYIDDFNDTINFLRLLSCCKTIDLSCEEIADLASIMISYLNEIEEGKILYQKAIDSAKCLNDYRYIAFAVVHSLEDTQLAKNLLKKAISYAEDSIDLQCIADSIMLLTKDRELTEDVIQKARSCAASCSDFEGLASCVYKNLENRELAIELFQIAEDNAVTSDDLESIACSIRHSIKDRNWTIKLLNKAKTNVIIDEPEKVTFKKKTKLQKNTEVVQVQLKAILEKLIVNNSDSFLKNKSYKVRPPYGPGKFYLNHVEGTYEDSLQLLIHYILYEENLYNKILSKKQMASCKQVVINYPESIYGPGEDEDGSIQELLDNIYHDAIRYVGNKLLSLGFNVDDDFAEFM